MAKTRIDGEGNIRLRSDGRWEVRVTVGIDFATGKAKRISKYAASKDEAVRILHELSYIKDTAPKSFDNMRLGEWLDLCLEVYMKNSIKQSTYNSYESYIRNHLKPSLGEVRLQDITPRMLQQFYNYKANEERLSSKTIININLFLHRALSYAVAEGYIRSNPTEAINLSRGQKPQIEILTRFEQNKLIQTSYQFRYGVFVRLVLFTGLRMGELLGLRWEDIDFQGRLLYVRRTLNRLNKRKTDLSAHEHNTTEIVIQTPKSQNSVRSIPLLPEVINDLYAWQAVQDSDRLMSGSAYNATGFVVTNVYGGYIEPRTFRDYYNQILEAAGLKHFTFHALRHTFASRAMEQGMDAKTLSVILGHYSVSFTLDTYAHVLTEHKFEGMKLMSDLFGERNENDCMYSYPVIMTETQNGAYCFTLPDFPELSFCGGDVISGIQCLRERLSEEIPKLNAPPQPTEICAESLNKSQTVLQIQV